MNVREYGTLGNRSLESVRAWLVLAVHCVHIGLRAYRERRSVILADSVKLGDEHSSLQTRKSSCGERAGDKRNGELRIAQELSNSSLPSTGYELLESTAVFYNRVLGGPNMNSGKNLLIIINDRR